MFFVHPHKPQGEETTTATDSSAATPKGTPITSHQPHIDVTAEELNNCPKATLDYPTPTQALNHPSTTTH